MKKIKFTKKDIKKLASLSRIRISQQETQKFTNDIGIIISSVDTLEDFDKKTNTCLKKVKYEEIPFKDLREDIIKDSMSQKDALANAPHQQSGYFKIYGDIFDDDNS